jgi:hypothetical protein
MQSLHLKHSTKALQLPKHPGQSINHQTMFQWPNGSPSGYLMRLRPNFGLGNINHNQ